MGPTNALLIGAIIGMALASLNQIGDVRHVYRDLPTVQFSKGPNQ